MKELLTFVIFSLAFIHSSIHSYFDAFINSFKSNVVESLCRLSVESGVEEEIERVSQRRKDALSKVTKLILVCTYCF